MVQIFSTGFPTRHQLWEGAVLSTIAHAIWVAAHPMLAGEEGWDGPNYCLTNGQGTWGTTTFGEQHTVAVFYDLHSKRKPESLAKGETYDLARYFAAAPPEVWQLAQREALGYMLFVETTVVTAVCWCEGERFIGREPWAAVVEHVAHLIRRQLLPTEQALVEWQLDYQFADDQVRLLGEVYRRKL